MKEETYNKASNIWHEMRGLERSKKNITEHSIHIGNSTGQYITGGGYGDDRLKCVIPKTKTLLLEEIDEQLAKLQKEFDELSEDWSDSIDYNDIVEYTLTKYGADILNEKAAKFCKDFPASKITFPKYKEGDIHTQQLWGAFKDFSEVSLGDYVPFTNLRKKKNEAEK